MAEIGKLNTLRIVKELDFGMYLDGGEDGEILLPKRYIPEGVEPEDEIEVFIYTDSEDRIIATTEIPYAMVGEFALLKVVAVNEVGAFLDWGLMKDILVPFREQKANMEEGKSYVVYIYLDEETNRIAASGKPDKFLSKVFPTYQIGEQVTLIAFTATDLGHKVIVNNSHWGLVYKNEVFQTIHRGDRLTGYIKKIYDDGKIDVSLQKPGYDRIDDVSKFIYDALVNANGFLAVNDKTPSEEIYHLFEISKKSFKMALGALYRERMITISDDGIRLVTKEK